MKLGLSLGFSLLLVANTANATDCASRLTLKTDDFPGALLACLQAVEKENEALLVQLNNVLSKPGIPGPEGKPGPQGLPGINGIDGKDGADGDTVAIPDGAVVAFVSQCPKSGWEDYKEGWGRFIIGAVSAEQIKEIPGGFVRDARGVDLSARPAGVPGGEEAHVLTIPELPIHNHKLFSVSDWNDGAILTPDNTVKQAAWPGGADPSYMLRAQNLEATLGKSSDVGGGIAHNVMPPFLALYLCKKTSNK